MDWATGNVEQFHVTDPRKPKLQQRPSQPEWGPEEKFQHRPVQNMSPVHPGWGAPQQFAQPSEDKRKKIQCKYELEKGQCLFDDCPFKHEQPTNGSSKGYQRPPPMYQQPMQPGYYPGYQAPPAYHPQSRGGRGPQPRGGPQQRGGRGAPF